MKLSMHKPVNIFANAMLSYHTTVCVTLAMNGFPLQPDILGIPLIARIQRL